jgi:DNA-binding transcriptional ArsR family regulator
VAADVAGAGRGVPDEWLAAARTQLGQSDLEALAPLGAPPGECNPGRITCGGVETESVADEVDRIATLPVDDLLEDIDFACGPGPAPRWNFVRRNPRRWLVSYATALARIWNGIREPWGETTVLVDREQERVETASEYGTLSELPAGIAGAEVYDGSWCFPDPEPLPLHLSEEGLTLRPVIGGPGAFGLTYHDDGLLTSITYPLPGAAGIVLGRRLPPRAALEALLGTQRTTILRHLDQPRSAGGLAKAMVATPGAATHHLRALEAAGLIVRERAGRTVRVHRTHRGSRLLSLYEDS